MSLSTFRLSISALALTAFISGVSMPVLAQNIASSTAGTVFTLPAEQGLKTTVFNPGEQAIFAVSSVLVEGKKEVLLIDAQFSAEQARKLVDMIKTSGKKLTTIYISHGDPDYYFGLDTLHKAFPDARIVATPQTVAHIEKTKDDKLKVWGPQLGENAPKQLIVPQPLTGDTLTLEGHELKIMGLDGPTPERTFVWIPSLKIVAGGIPVLSGEHVWMADTQTAKSQDEWLASLDKIKSLHPKTVIPGHFVETIPPGIAAVDFTAGYIRAFQQEVTKAKNSQQLIAAMKARYPHLEGTSSLELSAKVAKGELAWQ